MQLLEERILKDGIVKPGNVLKVDSFLNHQMDIAFINELGKEFQRRFADAPITKILTIEASGIGIACLAAAGVLEPPARAFAWWSWFVGDTLGVLTVAPLGLCFLLRSSRLWQIRRRLAVPMTLTLLLTGTAFYATTQWERTNRENRLQADGAQIRKRIADRLLAHQEALQSLRRFIESAPELTSSRFDAFTLSILQDNPEVSTLS